MRVHTPAGWVAVAAATTLLITACSGGSGEEAKRATLGSALGVTDAALDNGAVMQQGQELTAECMIEAGWEYIPVQYPDVQSSTILSDEDQVARIEQEGLGFAYSVLSAGTDGSSDSDPWKGFVDPNEHYVATLSEDEKAAYDISLWGTAEEQAQSEVSITKFDPSTGSEWSMTTSEAGCQGQAYAAAFANASAQTSEVADQIRRYWQDLQTRVKADPRTIKLNERWASCMRDSGYDYASPESFSGAAYAEFSVKVSEVTGAEVFADPTAGWTPEQVDDFAATHTDEEVEALFNPHVELTADQRRQLEAILVQEVAVALANHACTASLKDDAADIYADVEEQYTLDHADDLSALAASMAEQQ